MKEEIKLSEKENKCLKAMAEVLLHEEEGQAVYFRTIAKRSGIESVRRFVRTLARKGLAEYERGLFNEDGMAAGSGYALTDKGKELAEKLWPDL